MKNGEVFFWKYRGIWRKNVTITCLDLLKVLALQADLSLIICLTTGVS